MPEYQVVESTETEKHYSELGMITENVTKEQGALLKEALCKGKIFLNISGEMAWYIMCNVPFLPLKGSKTRVVCPPLTDYQVTTIDY